MKIALTATGPSLDSTLDPRFGRAQYFIIYDTAAESFEVVNNADNVNAAHGAGIQAAQSVINNGATVVITGNVGPKALTTLQRGGVKVITGATGSCRESLSAHQGQY